MDAGRCRRSSPRRRTVAPAGGFEPYGVGYVDLGDVIVEARLVGAAAEFEIGGRMQLTLLPVWVEADGTPVVTYAFAPAGTRHERRSGSASSASACTRSVATTRR